MLGDGLRPEVVLDVDQKQRELAPVAALRTCASGRRLERLGRANSADVHRRLLQNGARHLQRPRALDLAVLVQTGKARHAPTWCEFHRASFPPAPGGQHRSRTSLAAETAVVRCGLHRTTACCSPSTRSTHSKICEPGTTPPARATSFGRVRRWTWSASG